MARATPEGSPQVTGRWAGGVTLLALLLYVVRVLPWTFADLWFDELVTLSDFTLGVDGGASLADVFRRYPVANNHILYSAVLWVWVRLPFLPLTEFLLRLPSVLFGCLALLVAARCWRSWLGPRAAAAAAFALAVTPVFTAFSYQVRGYGLSFLLAVVLVHLTVQRLKAPQSRRGTAGAALAAAALPLVIPTNLLVPAALLLFVVSVRRLPLRLRARAAWPVAAGAAAGAAYYLTIWPQAARVFAQTSGWPNRWAVAGNLALAAIAALLPLSPLLAAQGRRPVDGAAVSAESGAVGVVPADGWRLLLCSAFVAAAAILPRSPAPYPRTFAVLLPVLMAGALLVLRDARVWRLNRPAHLLLAALLVNGFVWTEAGGRLTRLQMARGQYPQNLLQQFYRGSTGISEAAGYLTRAGADDIPVLVSFHDFPTARQLLGQTGARVLPEHLEPARGLGEVPPQARPRLRVLALNESEAERLLANAGHPATAVEVQRFSDRALYRPGEPWPLPVPRSPATAEP